jgi:hypothetical protein
MRLVRLRQRRWLLEHLVVKSTVDDSVPHAENVPFAQLQHIQKHKKKNVEIQFDCAMLHIVYTWLQAAQVEQARWKTASRALMASSLDPSGRYQRLQRLTLNYLSL